MLMFSTTALADLNPEDARGGYEFQIGANTFYTGLFTYPADPISYPDILQPFLLIKNGSNWDVIDEYDALWTDLQEDITPDRMAVEIIKRFNKTLEQYTTGGAMTWNQKLIAIFQLRLVLVNQQIQITQRYIMSGQTPGKKKDGVNKTAYKGESKPKETKKPKKSKK